MPAKAGVGALGAALLAVLVFLAISSWSRQPAAAAAGGRPAAPRRPPAGAPPPDDGSVRGRPARGRRGRRQPRPARLRDLSPLKERSHACRSLATLGRIRAQSRR